MAIMETVDCFNKNVTTEHWKGYPICELCKEVIDKKLRCEHPKNGYCAAFRLQAVLDAKTVNMHKPINKE